MALPLHIQVKESLKELRAILKNSSALLQPRIKMLIAIKKAGDNGMYRPKKLSQNPLLNY